MDMSSDRFKTAFNSIFRLRVKSKNGQGPSDEETAYNSLDNDSDENKSASPFAHRALPPLPPPGHVEGDPENGEADQEVPVVVEDDHDKILDYAASIERVKDCGWYWGPVSGEVAEKLLANEPDGSFIVRDSSDDAYIFSLTFKLNGLVRHVRIEHDQGEKPSASCEAVML